MQSSYDTCLVEDGSSCLNMKKIAMVAQNNKKVNILEWCDFNKGTLPKYSLYAAGTTGKRIIEVTDLEINSIKSGPYGGDKELGALIADEKLCCLVFF